MPSEPISVQIVQSSIPGHIPTFPKVGFAIFGSDWVLATDISQKDLREGGWTHDDIWGALEAILRHPADERYEIRDIAMRRVELGVYASLVKASIADSKVVYHASTNQEKGQEVPG